MKHLFRSVLTVATVVIGGPALAGQHIVTLSVPGMDCSACPAIVKGTLQKVAGVAKGYCLTLDEAMQVGRALFAPLLRPAEPAELE